MNFNPIPIVVALVLGMIAYLIGGLHTVLLTEIVFGVIVIIVSIAQHLQRNRYF